MSAQAIEVLCLYSWPGNVRELENVLQQVLLLTDARTIGPEHLPIPYSPLPRTPSGASMKQSKAQVLAHFEKDYLTELLREHHGNVSRAAQAAQTGRRSLGRLIKKHQLAKH